MKRHEKTGREKRKGKELKGREWKEEGRRGKKRK